MTFDEYSKMPNKLWWQVTDQGYWDAGAASRDTEVAKWKDAYEKAAEAALILSQEHDQLREQLSSGEQNVAEQKERCSILKKHIIEVETENAKLHKDVGVLRDEVIRCRDWFETQEKVVSKGGPSSWELMLLRDERDAAEEALATTEPKP